MSDAPARTAFGRTATAAVGLGPLPTEVTDHARLLIADALAVALIARHLGTTRGVDEGVRLLTGEGAGGATVIGARSTLPAGDAAFVNGSTIHALDFDDTHGTASVHPSAAVLPSALAATEQRGGDGTTLLRAYVLGAELVVRLGLLAPGRFHAVGIHPTGTLGAFGAALAAATVRRLDARATTDALGIALSLAPLTPLEFMTDGLTTKRVHAGAAARAGLEAAALAEAGMRGPATALEGPRGLLSTLLRPEDRPLDAHVLATLPEGFGERWHVLDVERKRYPVCHLIHPFLRCLDVLRARGPLDLDDVVTVECRIAPDAVPIVAEPRATRTAPVSGYAARFSLPYVLAAALLDGPVRSARFDDGAVGDPAVRALAERIVHLPWPGADWTHDGIVRVHRRAGAVEEVAVMRRTHDADATPSAPDDARAKLLAEDPSGALLERFTPVQEAVDGLGSGEGDLARLLVALRGLAADADRSRTGDARR
jgi:2-methylcitrate dehydratase PrpD